MKILIIHAIERNTLQLLIEAWKAKWHYIQACNMKNIEIYDGKIFSNKEDIASFDIILFREIRDNNEEAKMITTYLNENKKIIVDERIRDGKWGSKINTYLSLSKANIAFPKTMFFPTIKDKRYSFISETLWTPFITKTINGQQGKWVYLTTSEDEFETLKKEHTKDKFLFQEFIPNDWDIRVLILWDKILWSIKRTAQAWEFRNNVALWWSAEKIEISKRIGELALNASKLLWLQIAGVDIIIHKETQKPYILEVNRSPEFEWFMEATGIHVAENIISFLENYNNNT